MAKSGADFITTRDPGYPKLLKEIHDPPIGLYRKGRYDFAQPCVAIVGSRRTTLYGQSVAKKFGAELARLGFCVVSGLARGIDTAAHEGALSVGGKTAAVPGRIDQNSSAGCHQLIRDGATLMTNIDDLLNELNYLDGFRPQPIPLKGGEQAELAAVSATAPMNLGADEGRVFACFRGGAI